MIVVLFTPIWRIDLDAPQYPEGLSLNIYAKGLAGNVDIVNGLNHYIGMKTLHNNDFVEFTVLPYIISFFALLFLIIAIANKRRLLNIGFSLFVLFGVVAMVDFWKWEYDYGHNLNPDAAIKVPGMAYQPPLIGFKQLLNFGAYSIPDVGGWIFVAIGAILLFCVVAEFSSHKKSKTRYSLSAVAVTIGCMIFFSSCSAKPEPVIAGVDQCYFCKMMVSDAKFGTEIITDKGKKYKFDDMHCLLSFINSKAINATEIKDVYVTDFSSPEHHFIKANESFLLHSELLKSPMNGNIVAFANKDSLNSMMNIYKGEAVSWNSLLK
jgi:copper chaperone NosL